MSVFRPKYRDKTGELVESQTWWYEFTFAGRRIRESTKTARKTIAGEAEKLRRAELERALVGMPAEKSGNRIRTVAVALREYQAAYAVNHRARSAAWVCERSIPLEKHLGSKLIPDLTETCVTNYIRIRQKEGAGPRTINMDLECLSRAVGHPWRIMWPRLKRLQEPRDTGKALTSEAEAALMTAARNVRSKYIYPFLRIAFETGLRSGETRRLKWEQVVLGQTPEQSQITVGEAKTAAGTGRVIPMTPTLWGALQEHAGWLAEKLKEPIRPDWYVFPFSSRVRPVDPTRPVITIKTAWNEVREKAGVKARLHDARHTFISRLAEADIPEITMMQLAGHVSKSMLERYSHIRMETKRAALEKALGKRDRGETSIGVPKESPKVTRKPTLQ